MKYHLLSRIKSPFVATTSSDRYTYFAAVDSFQEVKLFIEQNPLREFRVIKGKELEWDEEYEEVITKQDVLKSRKLREE